MLMQHAQPFERDLHYTNIIIPAQTLKEENLLQHKHACRNKTLPVHLDYENHHWFS